MSCSTHVRLFELDADVFDQSEVAPKIDMLVGQAQLPEDVAADLKDLFFKGEAYIALEYQSIIQLVSKLAAMVPNVPFAIRGAGEEPRTIWVREYEGGKETFAFGPPEGGEF